MMFFGVHANCPNFVPLKRKKERKKKQRKEGVISNKVESKKRNERRG